MIHKEFCQINEFIGLCYSMLEEAKNNFYFHMLAYKLLVFLLILNTIHFLLQKMQPLFKPGFLDGDFSMECSKLVHICH